MRAVITNFGTRGDFEPFFALAAELCSHQYEPVFAIPASAVPMVEQSGYRYAVIASDDPNLRDRINLSWSTRPDAYEAKDGLAEEFAKLQSYFPVALRELSHLCSQTSVLISGPAQPLARIVHETTGVPFVSVQVSHFGGSGGPALREAGDQLVNPFRRKIGLASIKDPFTTGANSPQLALYAMSPHLRPRPATWPSHYHMTGFFFSPTPIADTSALGDFLEGKPAPIVVTFGSMPHHNPAELVSLVIRAIERCHCPAILQGFGLPTGALPSHPGIYAADYIPHSWLFPRAACIVTHGGAGTAAAVFRAGVPGVFVPHSEIYDQRYWSQLATELGCSVEAIPYQGLSDATLAAAVHRSMEDDSIRQKALDLATKLRGERGVQTACRMIETLISSVGLG